MKQATTQQMEMAQPARLQTDDVGKTDGRRRRKHRKRRRGRGIPAPVIFFFLFGVGLASAAGVYVLKDPFLPVPFVVSIFTAYALYVNDHSGFIRKKQMRRAYEARRTFVNVEVVLLLLSILINLFVAALVILT
jgi:hypothetical protein